MKTKKSKLVCGVGVNNLTYVGNEKAYSKWVSMLNRCYSPKYQSRQPTYIGCSVCDEWLVFSKFKEWYDINSIAGMQIDKDILIRGNKVYGPTFCRFVPKEINYILLDSGASRGQFKQGVGWHKGVQKFQANISRLDGKEHIGYFATEDDAFAAYKSEKEKWIKHQADHYFSLGYIDKDIHTALHNWTI